MDKIPLIAVVGPTATGKTALSVEIALKIGGEVVSADSMQIYKHLKIGTARPYEEEMKGVPHHLMDFLELHEEFSVADYVRMAGDKIRDIALRGKMPILCGGTGLYVSSLLENIRFSEVGSDEGLRQTLLEQAKEFGGQKLLEELSKFDPETAARLHPNDINRIIRAIEVYKLTGKTMSELVEESKGEPSPFEAKIIGLNYRDRARLYGKINHRVDLMLEKGLVKEAEMLQRRGGGKTVMQAIGYKELFPYIRGEVALSCAVEDLKRETRRYAKRQITWFKRVPGIRWIYLDDYRDFDEVVSAALEIVSG